MRDRTFEKLVARIQKERFTSIKKFADLMFDSRDKQKLLAQTEMLIRTVADLPTAVLNFSEVTEVTVHAAAVYWNLGSFHRSAPDMHKASTYRMFQEGTYSHILCISEIVILSTYFLTRTMYTVCTASLTNAYPLNVRASFLCCQPMQIKPSVRL